MTERHSGPASAARGRGDTASLAMYRLIRSEILDLRRKPGEAIAEKDIASRQNVSRTPIREALLRLADEGLVEIVPKSGTRVSRISMRQLEDAILARRALECVVLEVAVSRASRSDILQLQAILERQREADMAADQAAFHQSDEDFHAYLAKIGGHGHIWFLIQLVKTHIDRYRRLTLPLAGRIGLIIEEHAAIVRAIEARDTVAAVAHMRTHLEKLSVVREDIRQLNPTFFDDDWTT